MWLAVAQAQNDLAQAQNGPPQVEGMNLVTLEGPYRYDDGGVAVDGFILRPTIAGKPDVSPLHAGAVVRFEICNSDRVLSVRRGSLYHGRCPLGAAPYPWAAWLLKDDQLVASTPDAPVRAVPLAKFTADWQSLIKAPGEADDIRALSLPSASGESLAVIVRPSP